MTDNVKHTMKETVRVWSKSYHREIRRDFFELQDAAQDVFLTAEQIEVYHQSKEAEDAEHLFLELESSNIQLCKTDHSKLRDHLFVLLHTKTAHRSGVSANMTIPGVESAKYKEGYHLIKVKNHKTADFHGPAVVPMKIADFKLLDNFIKKVRPITNPQKDIINVFLSNNGRIMEPGSISDRINTVWRRLGLVEKGKRVCCNVIRKTVSSGARENKTGNFEELASLLSHSTKTAESNYVVRKREKDAVVGTETIDHLFTPSITSPVKKFTEQENEKLANIFSN